MGGVGAVRVRGGEAEAPVNDAVSGGVAMRDGR